MGGDNKASRIGSAMAEAEINCRSSISISRFMKKDGAYSWIVLITIIINNIICMGYLFSSVGVFADVYPQLLHIDQSQANIIGSTLVGVFLLSGRINFTILKCICCKSLKFSLLFYHCSITYENNKRGYPHAELSINYKLRIAIHK